MHPTIEATAKALPGASPFAGFWQAGFEGADHVNGSGQALDIVCDTGHVRHAADDYARLRACGIRVVRESVGWRTSVRGSHGFDFSSAGHRSACANAVGVQIAWTLFHYGTPPGVDLFHDRFVSQFADYCAAAATYLDMFRDERPPVYTPVNEISFLTWAATETGLLHPHRGDRPEQAAALKQRLVRATLAACEAIRAVQPDARFLIIDPLIHVAPGLQSAPDEALRLAHAQYEAWDMIAGRACPELGGDPRYLDLVGVNYYPHNQWRCDTRQTLPWPHAPGRRPLGELLVEVHARYRRPITVSETSHVGDDRAAWIGDVAAGVAQARQRGARIDGVCLYPALDRPDWERPCDWHRSGLWHVCTRSGKRTLETAYDLALQAARRRLDPYEPSPDPPARSLVMPHLFVFSHLRWDFVYQRPQHLLSRLARHWPVLFVEEPVPGDHEQLDADVAAPGVTVLRPRLRREVRGFDDASVQAVAPMLQAYLRAQGIDDYATWFYTPMALPLLDGLSPRAIVYDCMDQLSAFAHAPPQLVARERALMRIANVVFTGGPSLYDDKRTQHDNAHCIPSSVDVAHFARATDPALASPLFDATARPRLGYYGVIDERLDLALVERLADADPAWSICMVGPVVKIDPASLPQRPNLHWIGQQSYADLPALLAAWDVCLMPFALNDATRFISPTKTLEYMSAGKPVVSTAVADVMRLYSEGVHIAAAGDTDGFIQACRAALDETPAERATRQATQAGLVSATSWDGAADLARRGVDAALHDGLTAAARDHLTRETVRPLPADRSGSPAQVACLVLGAGPTGLSAAYHLGASSLTIDANAQVGGWCRSIEDGGFTFDYAGHIMFSNDDYVQQLYKRLLGDNMHWQDREAWVYSKGVHTRYPFQGALHGLPPDVLKECLVGAIEARFGAIDGKAAAPATRMPAANETRELHDCCGDGAVPDPDADACVAAQPDAGGDPKDAADSATTGTAPPPGNFEEFIYRVWGAGVARHFAIPYNRKLWTVPLDEMETSWLGGRVPLPDLEQMIEGALEPVAKPVGPNARFGYPLRGGFQALMDGFLPLLQGELRLSTRIVGLHPREHLALLDDGSRIRYTQLISTIPLPELVRLIGDAAPESVTRAAAALRHVSIRCVNLGVAREGITDKHWIYYPEDTVFHRIFVQGNASPHNNAPGGFALTCEISYSPLKPLPCEGEALIQRCIEDCYRVGMLQVDDQVAVANEVDMPYAYVVYDHAREANVAHIREWLAGQDILLAGRYSEWEYYNSDHAFLAGKRAAEQVLAQRAPEARTA